jgi:hypothetical protein
MNLNGRIMIFCRWSFLHHFLRKPGLTAEAKKSVMPNTDNLIAVHCLQKGGGQYIDARLYVRVPAATP